MVVVFYEDDFTVGGRRLVQGDTLSGRNVGVRKTVDQENLRPRSRDGGERTCGVRVEVAEHPGLIDALSHQRLGEEVAENRQVTGEQSLPAKHAHRHRKPNQRPAREDRELEADGADRGGLVVDAAQGVVGGGEGQELDR